MRKYVFAATLALSGALLLAACGQQENGEQQAVVAPKEVSKPADLNDKQGWNAYLGQLVQQNLEGMTVDRPYAYMIPVGDGDQVKGERLRQLNAVQDTVARCVLPGNLLAFAGPGSTTTAELVVEAFKHAQPGSFKGVIVLFVGDEADQEHVNKALATSGATFRFVKM